MSEASVGRAFLVISEWRARVFSDIEMHNVAENAYRQMVNEKILKDLHNTSSATVEKLVRDLIRITDPIALQLFLRNQNPNLLAFLYARFLLAYEFLQTSKQDAFVPVENQPTLLLEWALIDLWKQTPDSSDPY